MTRLSELGVLQTIFPPLKFTAWHAAKFRRVADGRALMFWGVLAFEFNAAEIEEFVKRLRLSNAERETLLQVCDLRGNEPALAAETLAPSALAHQLENYSDDALAIYALATDSPRVAERIELYRTRLRHIAPELTGDDLKQRGIPPSPQYRAILTRLRDARLDGQIATRAEEEEIVRRIVG
jgi:tRNA nucleotidyltransferase (CCA-adding enzyme)